MLSKSLDQAWTKLLNLSDGSLARDGQGQKLLFLITPTRKYRIYNQLQTEMWSQAMEPNRPLATKNVQLMTEGEVL